MSDWPPTYKRRAVSPTGHLHRREYDRHYNARTECGWPVSEDWEVYATEAAPTDAERCEHCFGESHGLAN